MQENKVINLGSVKVGIDVSRCFEYSHPIDSMEMLLNLLKWIEKNIDNLSSYNVNKSSLESLINKFEENMNYIYEHDFYLKEATSKYKKHKGFSDKELLTVGVPKGSFEITLEELLNFHKGISILEEEYDYVRKNNLLIGDSVYYFRSLECIKNMLERRLTYAIANK